MESKNGALAGTWAIVLGASSGAGARVRGPVGSMRARTWRGCSSDGGSREDGNGDRGMAIEATGRRWLPTARDPADERGRVKALDLPGGGSRLRRCARPDPLARFRFLFNLPCLSGLNRLCTACRFPCRWMVAPPPATANSLVYWTQDLLAREMMGLAGASLP